MDAPDCFFCRRLAERGSLPAGEVVWEFPTSVALLGNWQYFHGYCVLVSRTHAVELNDLSERERRSYFDEMCLLARAIDSFARPHKLNYEMLGNQVRHLHWHIFPRSTQDPDVLKPVWLALDRAERDSELGRHYKTGPVDRTATAAALRKVLFGLNAPTS
jgi:diadenosine tetraphosphate (Ap4A) HIT family hydrolase